MNQAKSGRNSYKSEEVKELLASAEVKKELRIEQPDDELLLEIPFDFSPTNQ